MTTVTSVAFLGSNNFTGVSDLVLEGYYGPGTGGGGTLINDPTAGAADGGLVFQDNVMPTPNLFRRVEPTGDVREWGAKCDAVIVTQNGTGGTAGQPTFTSPSAIATSYIGAPIVVVGAGTAGAPLATTIQNIVGTTVTLNTNIVTTFPTYLASDFVSITSGGTGYAVGDKYVMSDGTTIIVNEVGAGVVTSLTIFSQSSPLGSKPGLLTQSSSVVGSGTGLTCTLSYTATGQFAYGTDDSAAINAAMNAALVGGYDARIPQGLVCGVTSAVVMPAGSVYLRGYDMWTTGIVALASMTHVLDCPGDYGGGASDLFVEGMKVATSAIEVEGGRFFVFESVQARNAITQDWYIGTGAAGSGGFFSFCDGRTTSKMFGPAGQMSTYNWNIVSCQGSRFLGCTADGCSQSNFLCSGGGVYLLTCNFFGGACYAYCPVYNYDLNSPTLIAGCQAGSPKTAAYHVASFSVNMSNNFTQFGAAGYCDPVNTYGVLIEAAGTPYFTKDCAVLGSMDDNSVSAANLVVQLGTADPTTVVANNPRATYTTQPTIVGKNYFENAAMLVWQEATSYTFTAVGQKFLADRWKGYVTGNANITVSQDSGFSGAQYAMKVQRANGDGHNNSLRIGQQIETAIAGQLQGKTVIVSFDVEIGANYSGQSYGPDIRIYTGTGADETFSMSSLAFPTGAVNSSNLRDSTVVVTTTPQRVSSKVYSIPSSATEAVVVLTYSPTGTASTNDWIKITNVKLEANILGTPFEQQFPATTFNECRRFYAKTFALATTPAQNVGTATGEFSGAATKAGAAANLLGTLPFGTAMRIAPTVTTYNPANGNAQVRDETASADCSAVSVSSITETSCRVSCTGNAATAVGNTLGVHLTADARL